MVYILSIGYLISSGILSLGRSLQAMGHWGSSPQPGLPPSSQWAGRSVAHLWLDDDGPSFL